MCESTLEFVLFCSSEDESKKLLLLENKNADKQQPLLGKNFPCFLQMLSISAGKPKEKKTNNWKDMDLAEAVVMYASFRLGDEPGELRVCLLVPK